MNRAERRAAARRAPKAVREAVTAQPVATWWNGEPAQARRVSLVVDEGVHPEAWYRPFVGQRRNAVQVTYGGHTFYLDDEDGSGWRKVTAGGGSPRWSHRSLYPEPGTLRSR